MKTRLMAAVVAGVSGMAVGQTFDVQLGAPTLDRYMYPFAPTPGVEQSVPTFGAINQAGFDDRDAQMLLGYDLFGLVPSGLDESRYEVESARVTVYFSTEQRWRYDPTPDSVRSLYDVNDPEYVADPDPGTPVELYGVGYRNGQTEATFGETTAFSPFPPVPPREGVRSVYPAVFDGAGNATDISRQVRQRFDTTAMAVGVNPALAPGQLNPQGESLTFEVDLSDATHAAYFARACATGRLRLMVTTLEPASGGPGGGEGGLYPSFFTKENPTAVSLGLTASLTMRVRVTPGCDPDFNQDGNVDQDDVACLAQVVAGDPACSAGDPDFNGDGNVDQDDVAVLAQVVAGAGCP
ncbi:MAG: hypothetical protein SFZ24_06250 [Planctomycetota bacterium]|nr:hypothetical protein [Planctomycetota bacterium]